VTADRPRHKVVDLCGAGEVVERAANREVVTSRRWTSRSPKPPSRMRRSWVRPDWHDPRRGRRRRRVL